MGDSAVPEDANDRDVDRYQLGPGRTELCCVTLYLCHAPTAPGGRGLAGRDIDCQAARTIVLWRPR